MNWNTPAKIMSAAFIGLGQPEPELLQRSELADIVFQRLAFYYEGIRSSDQNLVSKWTDEFQLPADTASINLSTLTDEDILMPLWAERRQTADPDGIWEFIPAVNLDTLAEKRSIGEAAVAFSGTNRNDIVAEFSYFGNEVSPPAATFRIRYAPVGFAATGDLSEAVGIPDNFTPLLIADVKLHAIPLLQVNASKYLALRPELQARVAAWGTLAQQLVLDREEWSKLYESFIRRSRTSGRARNRSDVLSGSQLPKIRRYYG